MSKSIERRKAEGSFNISVTEKSFFRLFLFKGDFETLNI